MSTTDGNETDDDALAPLKETPLRALHDALGARMTAFAGYAMPLQYPAGVMKEHLHTRAAAGLFDVSHMGQIALCAGEGRAGRVLEALEALSPASLIELTQGRQRYALLTSDEGGILDDLMVAHMGDWVLLVVNAARKDADEARLRDRLPSDIEIERLADHALIALQGPKAARALTGLAPGVGAMKFMDVRLFDILGASCAVSRSGYTGEDGYEISVPAEKAAELADALLARAGVAPIGLGARDSLRLEAGLCLYGADMTEETSPMEASLLWAIGKARRPGGARAGGYAGAERIGAEIADGVARRRVGLRPEGRAPIRAGAALYADESAAEPIGRVTSGVFGPSAGAPVAMGYAPAALAAQGAPLYADLRGRRIPVAVAATPFVPHRHHRG